MGEKELAELTARLDQQKALVQSLEDLIRSPGWKVFVQKCEASLESAMRQLIGERKADEKTWLQGRIQGIEYALNLPNEARHTLTELEAAQREALKEAEQG